MRFLTPYLVIYRVGEAAGEDLAESDTAVA